jgi:hypothetical protein
MCGNGNKSIIVLVVKHQT